MTRTIATQMISLDGFSAGPDQSLEHPLGRGAEVFREWMFGSDHPADRATVRDLHTPVDACLMGRNMFGPVRGPWESWDGEWRGWWGEDPPYHSPVVVLTHHEREPLELEGGNTFLFETGGFEAGYARAVGLAGPDGTVRVTGGCSTVRQAIEAGVLDELQLVQVPVLLGDGERLLEGLPGLRLEPLECAGSPYAVHVRYRVLAPRSGS
ncbi:dihydrofolate reductase family protein [Nocardioides marmoribigeumensis]|uniref:Dihydrofolate reductase n=1 Tax=Nocardioides marmoribigeumensis TaxID=433649 RepID=A0ABU2C1Q9_9ACTN|nr:dihydrofolate reductase family protein [Nocardioides marmoribigeumensis]MDR7364561.1 dihydrofolate reductase [Nocardioides marmoribigeumensis]